MTLAAVEGAARTAASSEAEAIRGAAHERARRIIDDAHTERAAVIERRRSAAERLAELEERERLAKARAEASAKVLHAQRSVLLETKAAAHAAASSLAGDPRFERLLDSLKLEARERLASAGPVYLTAADGGGFVARAANRELDYSLDAQVDRCLDAMASELEELWR